MAHQDREGCPHLARAAGEVHGLSFRGLRDASEAGTMSRLSHLSWKADGVEWLLSPEDIASGLAGKGSRRGTEVVFAELGGTQVGYAQVSWDEANPPQGRYRQAVHLLPEWRGRGIREAMFRSNEERMTVLATEHGLSGACGAEVWALDVPSKWRDLVESSGYAPVWHLLEMVRRDLGSVEDVPAPAGLDFGPVLPDDHPKVWALCRDCFSEDMWSGPERWNEESYREWVASDRFRPELWKVARSGTDVVGLVENQVSEEECRTLGRRVAHCNMVCVREDWRRKGVATYLLKSSLKSLRDIGIEEATLDTEVENVSRAMRVYEAVGFVLRRNFTFYRKPL